MKNIAAAQKRSGEVNHILGDSHYLAFGLPRRGLVLTIHDCATLERLEGPAREIFRRFWFTGPIARSAVITTISQASKDEILRWTDVAPDRIRVVPNCVREEFQREVKAPTVDHAVVLQVGTKWNKNLERVAEALRGIPCRLEIVGELSEAQRMSLSKTGISYRELGRLSDEELLEAYRRCDLVVFASIYEGFGLPIIEGQALGRPVVTSNFGAMAEAAGEGAAKVDPLDPQAIHAAVIKILSDHSYREHLIDAGFRNVEKYQPRTVANQYAAIYAEVSVHP